MAAPRSVPSTPSTFATPAAVFIERVGFYNPMAAGQAVKLQVNLERVAYWQSKGAQLSDTVARLVKEFKAQPAPAAEEPAKAE